MKPLDLEKQGRLERAIKRIIGKERAFFLVVAEPIPDMPGQMIITKMTDFVEPRTMTAAVNAALKDAG